VVHVIVKENVLIGSYNDFHSISAQKIKSLR